MEHVGIVVDDLAPATESFVELRRVLQGEGPVGGRWVDRVVGSRAYGRTLRSCKLRTARDDSSGRRSTHRQTRATTGTRRRTRRASATSHFAVEDIDAVVAGLRARGAELVGELERYQDSYRLCYVRGPEGIIIDLAEQIGYRIGRT
jgi:catechol 2,3-dioxygenase-like lactoylglutathione lyase family enzyme